MGFRDNFPGRTVSRGRLLLAAFSAYAWLLSAQGCGTEIPDPEELSGVVLLENGKPFRGATVIALRKSNADNGIAPDPAGSPLKFDTSYTNDRGFYQFDNQSAGTYDLIFEDSSSDRKLWRRNDALAKNGVETIKLKQPCLVVGNVYDINDGIALGGAFCQVRGTPYGVYSDDQGRFQIYMGISEGQEDGKSYSISCHKIPYSSTTSVVEVSEGSTKLVPFPLELGPRPVEQPFPETVSATYDSVIGVVNLSWSKVDFPLLYMYGVQRIDSALGGGPKVEVVGQEKTTFQDVVYGPTDTVSRKVLFYKVYSLKKDFIFNSNPDMPVVRVVATRPTAHGADVSLKILGDESAFKVGDTAKAVATFRNVFRDNTLLEWKLKNTRGSLRIVALTGRSGQDTLAFPCETEGRIEIGVSITDKAERVTSLYRNLEILPAH